LRPRNLVLTLTLVALGFALLALAPQGVIRSTPVAFAQSDAGEHHCGPVGGTIMTNLGSIGSSTMLGTATGDLKGAVAATILKVSSGSGGTTVFTLIPQWVTEAGDDILFYPAEATATKVVVGVKGGATPTVFGVLTFPLKIKAGTGRFAGATGTLENIGELEMPGFPDITYGRTVLRYSGQVCLATPGNH
jgi:hypothetical protein